MSRAIRLSAGSAVFFLALGMAAAPAPAAPSNPPLDKDRARAIGLRVLQGEMARHGNAGSVNGLTERRTDIDSLKMGHVRVQQTYRGVPVFGGEAIAHLNPDGSLRSVTDALVPSVHVASATPSVSRDKAIAAAMSSARLKAADVASSTADLSILRQATGDALTWRVRLVGTEGRMPSIPVAFIDATSGKKVWGYDDLQTDTGHSGYAGDVTVNSTFVSPNYQLKDPTRGNQNTTNLARATSGTGTLYTSTDTDWGTGLNSSATTGAGGETAAVDATYAAQLTWDYYKNIHGRNGIWNNGTGARSRVHYGTNYVNAFWDGTQMTYGDGSGNTHPLTSIDVGGHEMSHGVTENTAGLTYSGESGGLNEATSDIFGTAVEWNANNAADVGDYLIAEKVDINGDGTPLRYMDKPSRDGGSKDCWYSGIGNVDVHYSSGPANHFYYLASEGSGAKVINGVSYNSPTCNGSTVTGIGHVKVEKIWYRALTTYMTTTTNYASARTATLNAAADLYGGSSSAEYDAVCKAWAGVGVGSCGAPPSSTVLQNGVPISNLSGNAGNALSFTMVVPSGATNLKFAISGGTGDADLYVKFGTAPSLSSYDCRPYLSGNNETCNIATAQAGTYYVMVNAYSNYTGVTLVGSYTPPNSGGGALTNGVPVSNLGGATGSTKNFTLAVPAGASNLKFVTSGGTGDVDMYVKFGSAPTTSSYDCRPYLSGNSETCTFATPNAGTYYVLLNAYSSYSGVTLTGSYSTGSVLQNGVPISNLTASTGQSLNYSMVVPAGTTTLSFKISGGTGDADLYTRFGSAPTTTTYTCRPYLSGNNETCTVTNPTAGTWYVMVRAYATFSGVTLVGTYS
jgi:Zn-dependent metalloprotease